MPRIVILLILAPAILVAQTAALRGVVTDESGALVPGARVNLQGGPAARRAVTDNAGAYTFPALTPGDYTVQASAPNLAQPQPAKITLHAGPQTLNLTLAVAAISEKVTVADTSAPRSPPIPPTMPAPSCSAAPISKPSPTIPTISPPTSPALAGPSAGPNGGSIFVDGFSGGQLPPKESIREIRINQNPFSPEYDKLGYGKIEIFTKPGSDKYRGTAQWNFANDFWNTRNPYSPDQGALPAE